MAGVVFVHTWAADPSTTKMRVTLFFVVSAYLMTRLLLNGVGGNHPLVTIRNFYIRRELRLLPALFALLAVVWLFDIADARSSIWWHLLQLTNVYFYLYNTWEPWVLDHLWSLSVLEQFCLIWAPLVILLPRRALIVTLWALVAVGVLYRMLSGADPETPHTLPFEWADAMAAGALIAVHYREGLPPPWIASGWVLAAALVLLVLPFAFTTYSSQLYQLQLTVACVAMLMGALRGYSGWLGSLLSSRAIGYVGKLSYGVFMYHLLAWLVLSHLGLALEVGWSTFAIVLSVSLVLAAVSYHLYELPIARLKRFVPVEPVAGSLQKGTVETV
jgi:peptidoglycan/LPS O-acetylase OafA/YrhL